MTDPTQLSQTQASAPPDAIPVDRLYNGLRGQLQKDEHVLWQGKGSGRALDAFNPALIVRLSLLAVGVALLIYLMLDNRSSTYNWVAWALGAVLAGRLAWFVWRSSATPSRQVAMLTTRRLISIDQLRPITNWMVTLGGEGRADGKHAPPHPIIVTGTKQRGHIRLNRAPQNTRAYPPYILFNAERPLEIAALIKQTLNIDQPIEDRTK
ncbi:MAG: hypothetical protein RIR33_104 [Pseudomonadota bacterium]|jgi:hypothetical protein